MTNLNCCAVNCAHNNNNCCCIGSIKVGGNQAIKSESTCCDSFQEKSGAATNCSHTPNPQVDISCKASNCVHNSNCACNAEHVDIAGYSACDCGETKCSSFCCK